MVVDKIDGNQVNTYFLIYEIFAGNANKALEVARRFPRTSYTLTPKSIERYLIIKYICDGATDADIIEALSTEEHVIHANRVSRLRKEVENGKREE
jgi:hypothetical protein